MVNWKFENNVLTSKSKNFKWCYWFGRLGVCYNKNTKKYVLIAQHNEDVMFAQCSSPTGNFEVKNYQNQLPGVLKAGTGDQTVFVDDDGTPYIICSNKGGRGHQYVVPLRKSDYLAADTAKEVAKGHGREGNCLFKYKGKYYFCASDLHGYNSSHTYYMVASNINGPYTSWKVMPDTDADFSHVTQTGFFYTVKGSKQETVLFCGDRWSDFAGNGIGYNQWVPLTVNGNDVYFNSLSEWNLNASTGQWSVGKGNNYILNPSFEADRVNQATLAGWTTSGTGTQLNINKSHTGNWGLQHWNSSAYKAQTKQIVKCPNGKYTLKFWARSSGGQKQAYVYVKGAKTYNAKINSKIDSYKEFTVSNIEVNNGSVEVGIFSDANAGNWAYVDDFSLVLSDGGVGGVVQPTEPTKPTEEITAEKIDESKTYMLKNVNSGLYMEVEDGKAENSANVMQAAKTAQPEPKNTWNVVSAGNGYYSVKSNVGDFYLDCNARKADNGTNIAIYQKTGGTNQQYKFTKNKDGSYKIRTKVSNDKSAVEVKDALKVSGANVQEWEVNGANCQDWILEPVVLTTKPATTTTVTSTTTTTTATTEAVTTTAKASTTTADITSTESTGPMGIKGDVNGDNKCDIADIIALQKWLIRINGYEIKNYAGADLSGDGIINVKDLTLLKAALLKTE